MKKVEKTNKERKKKSEKISILAVWKQHPAIRLLLFVALGLVMYLLFFDAVKPVVYHFNVNDTYMGDTEIRAPRTVVDEEKTADAREQAAKRVQPVYTLEDSKLREQLQQLENIFAAVKEINSNDELSRDERVTQIQNAIPFQLSEESYQTLATIPPEILPSIKVPTTDLVMEVMLPGIRQSSDEDMQQALQYINEKLAVNELRSNYRKVVQELAKASVVPNELYDQQKTEELRQQAMDNVEEITVSEGELLLKSGQIITNEIYRNLKLVGLLETETNPFLYIGTFLTALLVLATIYSYLYLIHPRLQLDNKGLTMYVAIVILALLVMAIFQLGLKLNWSHIGFIVPGIFAIILTMLYFDSQLALFTAVILSLFTSVMFNEQLGQILDFRYGFSMMVSSITAIVFLQWLRQKKSKILIVGLMIALANMISIVTISMLEGGPSGWSELWDQLVLGLASGFISSVLAMGIMPFFETIFGILSDVKLIELSNPNHPLLRKLLLETPGTYHHSVMVGNLAEAAAEAIQANGLLARVGSYYHDVGKMKRPRFFIENQMGGENPHDKISPSLSKTIIIAHPYDGVEMLKEYRIPKAIQDIAEQHHGTTLLRYFYHKAKEQSEQPIQESDFRYPGPKAQFKEAAIVGIADSVEAAVRSLSKPTPEKIELIVHKIVKDRLEDGQFDECHLTLKELDIITKTILQTLHGTFHSRIEYPDEKDVTPQLNLPKQGKEKGV
ncbi:HD family phosphohydrolase [Rubeoparvulum massiliense]|uniref:HD family phosphohydrolase n=1 Tax=Rubeoparvulum massiliense TaxID=1631346 RepID=UPI00065E9857|nr:HDIG domain-containing metalloprotein [Rubeoparvulum massiliense]